MNEITFIVEEASEGGYTARALGESIFTEADTWDELKEAALEAIVAHFEERNQQTSKITFVPVSSNSNAE